MATMSPMSYAYLSSCFAYWTLQRLTSIPHICGSPGAYASTTIMGLSPGPQTTSNGPCFMSLCTDGLRNLLPIKRLASAQTSHNKYPIKHLETIQSQLKRNSCIDNNVLFQEVYGCDIMKVRFFLFLTPFARCLGSHYQKNFSMNERNETVNTHIFGIAASITYPKNHWFNIPLFIITVYYPCHSPR